MNYFPLETRITYFLENYNTNAYALLKKIKLIKLTIALIFLSHFAVFYEFTEVGNRDKAVEKTQQSQVLSNAYVVLFLCPRM